MDYQTYYEKEVLPFIKGNAVLENCAYIYGQAAWRKARRVAPEGIEEAKYKLNLLLEDLEREGSALCGSLKSIIREMQEPAEGINVVYVDVALRSGLDEPSSELDFQVPGRYRMELLSTVKEHEAQDAALDIFHSRIAIKVLEDFTFTVKDKDGNILVTPLKDHTPYYAANRSAIITKL